MAAVLEHDYLQIPFTEYLVNSALKVNIISNLKNDNEDKILILIYHITHV